MSPEDLESLFKKSYTAIFCSHNSDGTIHAAPIWYNYKDEVFYFASFKKSRRGTNVKRDKNVSLSLLMQGTQSVDGDVPSKCALVYGLAETGFEPEMGYDEYLRWVWGKYSDAGSNTDQNFDHETFEPLKVVPTKIVHF